MYEPVLLLHSLNRWMLIILGAIVVVDSVQGWLQKRSFAPRSNRLGLFFVMSVDVQLLLGILLYVFSPFLSAVLSDPGKAMSNSVTRFWAVEHGFGMLVAIILVHVARASLRKTAEEQKYRRAAILYGLGWLIMLVSTPWPFMKYGRPLY